MTTAVTFGEWARAWSGAGASAAPVAPMPQTTHTKAILPFETDILAAVNE
jgi:hypothetical protein